MKRIAALLLLASLSAQNALAFDSFTVSDIRIDGLSRIASGTVFTYLPVEKGDVIGCVRYSVNGKVLKETPLVSSEDCALQKDERTWLQKWFARFLRSTQ